MFLFLQYLCFFDSQYCVKVRCMGPITIKVLHMIERNVNNRCCKSEVAISGSAIYTFPQNEPCARKLIFEYFFSVIILFQSDYSASEMTKNFGVKRGFKFDH